MRNMKISFKLVAVIVIVVAAMVYGGVGVFVFEKVRLGAVLGADGKSLWEFPGILAEAESKLDIPAGISY